MQDWQGCLEPLAQQAWLAAKEAVTRRGGSLVSVEDYLLALLATHPSLTAFLVGWSIDIDELIRTIQSEQSPFELASSAEWLAEWCHYAQEQLPDHVLSVGLLLRVLCQDLDRFAQKAYVAVLQLVPAQAWKQLDWPDTSPSSSSSGDAMHQAAAPLFGLHQEARNLAVQLLSPGYSVIWLNGPLGCGKSSLLLRTHQVLEQIKAPEPLWRLDWSRPLPPGQLVSDTVAPGWCVLEHCRPSEALGWLQGDGRAVLLSIRRGEVRLLLESSSSLEECQAFRKLLGLLGLRGLPFSMPLPDSADALAILRLHQSRIERQCRIELLEAHLEAAVAAAVIQDETGMVPEGVVPGMALHHLAVKANQLMLQLRLEKPILARLRDLRADRLTRQVVGLAREASSVHGEPVDA